VQKLCVDAFGRAQTLQRSGQLVAARRELITCGASECPEVVKSKCVVWLEDVDHAMPSVVVAARDGARDIIVARVHVDGVLLRERLDGTAIELDPGVHSLVVEHEGRQRELRIVLREGEKRRPVEIQFAPPPRRVPRPRPPAPKPSPDKEPETTIELSVLSWVGFSTSAAALVVGTVTGIVALVRGKDLQDRCDNDVCHPAEKSDFESGLASAHVATVSFAVAGLGAAIGIVGVVVWPPYAKPKEPEPKQSAADARSWGLTLEGSF
jgi:hypothetical protein